jgi:uncharacterized protein (DUF433 family)
MDTDKLIQERNGELYVGPTRVLVWVIAAAYERGETLERIHEGFPTISLTEVMGTIIYYLEHKEELVARFAEDERVFEEWAAANRAANAEFIDAMRARIEASRQRRRESGEQVGEAAEA